MTRGPLSLRPPPSYEGREDGREDGSEDGNEGRDDGCGDVLLGMYSCTGPLGMVGRPVGLPGRERSNDGRYGSCAGLPPPMEGRPPPIDGRLPPDPRSMERGAPRGRPCCAHANVAVSAASSVTDSRTAPPSIFLAVLAFWPTVSIPFLNASLNFSYYYSIYYSTGQRCGNFTTPARFL